MLALWVFILSILLITLLMLVGKGEKQAWTGEALRLLWAIALVVAILLLASINLIISI